MQSIKTAGWMVGRFGNTLPNADIGLGEAVSQQFCNFMRQYSSVHMHFTLQLASFVEEILSLYVLRNFLWYFPSSVQHYGHLPEEIFLIICFCNPPFIVVHGWTTPSLFYNPA